MSAQNQQTVLVFGTCLPGSRSEAAQSAHKEAGPPGIRAMRSRLVGLTEARLVREQSVEDSVLL